MSARDVALMLLVAGSWSGVWVVGKVGVSLVPPVALSAVRFVLAGALLLGLARATGAPVARDRWPALLALAATGILGYNALVFTGLVLAPATDGGLLVPTFVPVLSAVLAAAFAGEPMTREKVSGLLVSMAGVALIVVGGTALGSDRSGDRLLGDLLILAGALCWAIYTVLGKSVLRYGSPVGITGAACFLGGLMLLPAAAIFEGSLVGVLGWPVEAWLAIAYMVVFGTVVAFVAYYAVVASVGASRAAMTTYLVPVGTLVLAAVFLGERVAPLQLVGGALTLLGVRVATVREGEGAWLRRFAGI